MRLVLFFLFTFFVSAQGHAQEPKRIVSIGGANTEILYALGFEKQIVGTDTSSVYPEAAQVTPKVGYARALSVEGILSLRPNLVILNDQAGPPAVLAQLKQVGVPILVTKAARSLADTRRNIETIATSLNAPAQKEGVLAQIDRDLALLKDEKTGLAKTPRVLFIMQHGGGAPMVAGEETAADSILKIAGAENAVTGYEGYKPLTPEAVVKMDMDYILVTDLGVKAAGGMDKLLSQPGIRMTEAAKKRRVIVMEPHYLLGFGPRVGEAALKLHQQMKTTSS